MDVMAIQKIESKVAIQIGALEGLAFKPYKTREGECLSSLATEPVLAAMRLAARDLS